MNFLIGLLLGLFLGVITGFLIKKPKDTYNYIIRRLRAKKGGKIDVSQLNEKQTEEQLRNYVLNNPEKDRKRLIDRIRDKREFKRELKKE